MMIGHKFGQLIIQLSYL